MKGRDTTASTLTFATYMLAMHPEILAKLRAEILQTVGSTAYPTYDDIRNMKYLRAFINGNESHFLGGLILISGVYRNVETVFSRVRKDFFSSAHTWLTFSVLLFSSPFDIRYVHLFDKLSVIIYISPSCTIGATVWPSTTPGEKPYYIPPATKYSLFYCRISYAEYP